MALAVNPFLPIEWTRDPNKLPTIAAPMPLVMWLWLRLRKLRRNDAGRTDFEMAS